MYTVLRGKARLRCLTQSWHSREGHSQRLHSHRCRHSFDANLDWLIRSTKDSCYCLAGFHGCDVHVVNGHHSVVKLDTTLLSRAAGHYSGDDQSTRRLVWECIPLQQRLGGRVSANPVLGDISG